MYRKNAAGGLFRVHMSCVRYTDDVMRTVGLPGGNVLFGVAMDEIDENVGIVGPLQISAG